MTPIGVLIATDIVHPRHIAWAALWTDNRWRTIFHRAAAGLVITGAEGGNPRIGVHPGMLAS